jgi:predicted nucleic acid-binding protein
MALIADSGAICALYDARDRHHAAVAAAIENEPDTIIVPMAVLAEIDYLVCARIGTRAALRFLEDVKIGGFVLEPLTSTDVSRCHALHETYADLELGLADASIIAAAERLKTRRILTVVHRHFRTVRALDGKPFQLLPAHAS